ncbi:hypothetical protein K438DRAFT_618932 [Mycena galopus ATCC 62051]|nr:hypothetical protein K438DRAFT_618932 [Mycena galopus ATCC 62051]
MCLRRYLMWLCVIQSAHQIPVAAHSHFLFATSHYWPCYVIILAPDRTVSSLRVTLSNSVRTSPSIMQAAILGMSQTQHWPWLSPINSASILSVGP